MCSLSFAKTLLFMLNNFATACYTFSMGYYSAWKDLTGPTKNDLELGHVTMKGGEYVIGDVEAAWRRANYCPSYRETPEQEFDMVQALSSNEGVISPKDTAMSIGSVKAEQVSKQGDYTVQPRMGIFTPSFNSEGEVASVPLPFREYRRKDIHGGGMPTTGV